MLLSPIHREKKFDKKILVVEGLEYEVGTVIHFEVDLINLTLNMLTYTSERFYPLKRWMVLRYSSKSYSVTPAHIFWTLWKNDSKCRNSSLLFSFQNLSLKRMARLYFSRISLSMREEILTATILLRDLAAKEADWRIPWAFWFKIYSESLSAYVQ